MVKSYAGHQCNADEVRIKSLTITYRVQGNTSNIVFLKSTDDAMLDTLQKMSGITHKSFIDGKSISRDVEKMVMKNASNVTYNMSTKEMPVISYNDMAFISERNSIIFRAGDAPIWNRNETILPMSWRLFKNTITAPGKNFSLQTIPTLSTALDFDIKQNQPDFVKLLDKRMSQAILTQDIVKMHKEAYGYTDAEIAKLDIDAYSDEIMDLINTRLAEKSRVYDESGDEIKTSEDDKFNGDDVPELDDDEINEDEYYDFDESMFDDGSDYGLNIVDADALEENTEVQEETERRQEKRDAFDKPIYANNTVSKSMLLELNGKARHGLDKDFINIFKNYESHFWNDSANFRNIDNNLYSIDGKPYITKIDNAAMIQRMNEGIKNDDERIYGEEELSESEMSNFANFEVHDEFYFWLASLDSWANVADGMLEDKMALAITERYNDSEH